MYTKKKKDYILNISQNYLKKVGDNFIKHRLYNEKLNIFHKQVTDAFEKGTEVLTYDQIRGLDKNMTKDLVNVYLKKDDETQQYIEGVRQKIQQDIKQVEDSNALSK